METTLKKMKNMNPVTMRKETYLYRNVDVSHKMSPIFTCIITKHFESQIFCQNFRYNESLFPDKLGSSFFFF